MAIVATIVKAMFTYKIIRFTIVSVIENYLKERECTT